MIEKEIVKEKFQSKIEEVLIEEMQKDPSYWKDYHDKEDLVTIKYGFLGRTRYYWDKKIVEAAFEKLISNLQRAKLTIPLVSQYFPDLVDELLKISLESLGLEPVQCSDKLKG